MLLLLLGLHAGVHLDHLELASGKSVYVYVRKATYGCECARESALIACVCVCMRVCVCGI